ncbi:MAG TPA: type I-F CRISPR-associated protein Csy1 [Marinospirillum sp.]|uniref:type I-F CRISPR-associated protein Csy1 n=1 Tax=Marinospirillum sp. TaxID=2183934 RepID=UPI002B46B146|nr:type I-F CRISPR-associated protein Csy1 [Marinospirillum sp.]HKM15278.1 type I-F CRISPR-associated protein Csy1 [Marinospirillum sp.]
MFEQQENNTWPEVISNFLNEKFETDFAKYLKEVFKTTEKEYEQEKYFNNEDLAFVFDIRKNKKAEGQKETEFLLQQLEKLNNFPEKPSQLNLEVLNSEVINKKQELLNKYSPDVWITWAAENAKNVTFATHVSKLTHSAIDSPSFFDEIKSQNNAYFSSSSLNKMAIDGAVRGNQYAPIYQLLELELNKQKLVSEFNNIETDLLKVFAKDEEQKAAWNLGFSAALSEGKPAAHFLLKQVYFPIADNQYHLLCNLVSSSKAQALFEFYRRNPKDLFKTKNNNKYSNINYFNFPNRASISITASNHGNASQLNGSRGGRLGLYSCQPPVWHSNIKPPVYRRSFFSELSRTYAVQENIQFLADFLERFESLQLSIKDPKRMHWIYQWLENLTDEVMVYVKTIQALPVGWSATKGIKLKPEHQVLLDCFRQDEEFITLQLNSNWQVVIAQDFAAWLNSRLNKVNKNFTPQEAHSKLWEKLFEANFRETLEINSRVKQETGL